MGALEVGVQAYLALELVLVSKLDDEFIHCFLREADVGGREGEHCEHRAVLVLLDLLLLIFRKGFQHDGPGQGQIPVGCPVLSLS